MLLPPNRGSRTSGIAIAVSGPVIHLHLLLWLRVHTQGNAFGFLHSVFEEGVGGSPDTCMERKATTFLPQSCFCSYSEKQPMQNSTAHLLSPLNSM